MYEFFKMLAFGISVGAYAPYILSIIKGVARPKKATWLVWALVDAIILYAMLSQGEDAPQMLAYLVGATTIFLLSLWYGESGWTREDLIVLAGSGIALLLRYYTDDPNTAILTSLIAVTIATVPTIHGILKDPGQDDWFPWTMWFVGGICTALSIEHHSIAASLGPLWFLCLQSAMVLAFLWKSTKVMMNRL